MLLKEEIATSTNYVKMLTSKNEMYQQQLATTVNQQLPFSMEPEYLAAQRAYMRYHNMDPIFGISSK